MTGFEELFGKPLPHPKEVSPRMRGLKENLFFLYSGFYRGRIDLEDRDALKMWFVSFQEYDQILLRRAIEKAILTEDWFPSIATLRKIVEAEIFLCQEKSSDPRT